MDLKGTVAVVTGAASGIGRASALKFAAEGAAGVVVADVDEAGLAPVAQAVNGLAVRCDVSRENDVRNLVREAEKRYGRVDVFFSNAGILGGEKGFHGDDEIWERMWKIHVMAHVWAARAVVDSMVERGGGYFVITASAAGLLNIVESASYGLTVCAERNAVFKAISEGAKGFRAVAVVTDAEPPASPCGACRQVLWDQCRDIDVVIATPRGIATRTRLSALLPMAFEF